jgi:hypothetical protein
MGEAWNQQQSGQDVVNAWTYFQGVVSNDIPDVAQSLDNITATSL